MKRPTLGSLRGLGSNQGSLGAQSQPNPADIFWSYHYLRHNQRRQEHLATLGLPIPGKSVLEVGAGIGDHTSFFVDRGCSVVTAEARDENLVVLRARYPDLRVLKLDLDDPEEGVSEIFDVVYCYGTLYHLQKPADAIRYMADRCRTMLLLETCVSMGPGEAVNLVSEVARDPSQSIHGEGCRPTRLWVFNRLKEHFGHVYLPSTQPSHEEFPTDWRSPYSSGLTRSVFIASREALMLPVLIEEIPEVQTR